VWKVPLFRYYTTTTQHRVGKVPMNTSLPWLGDNQAHGKVSVSAHQGYPDVAVHVEYSMALQGSDVAIVILLLFIDSTHILYCKIMSTL
jgi:hypothetical protein